jgi:hypothetical protein
LFLFLDCWPLLGVVKDFHTGLPQQREKPYGTPEGFPLLLLEV